MHAQLYYTIAQERSTELQRAGARARIARDVRAAQHSPRRSRRIARLTARLTSFNDRVARTGP